jgi:hypothetical protein
MTRTVVTAALVSLCLVGLLVPIPRATAASGGVGYACGAGQGDSCVLSQSGSTVHATITVDVGPTCTTASGANDRCVHGFTADSGATSHGKYPLDSCSTAPKYGFNSPPYVWDLPMPATLTCQGSWPVDDPPHPVNSVYVSFLSFTADWCPTRCLVTTHDFALHQVQAPAITVASSPTVPPGGLPLGGTLDVPVTVTAGDAALTNVSVALTGTAGRYEIVKKPDTTSGLSLAAHGAEKFVWTIRGETAGAGTVTVTATGTSGSQPVSDSDAHSVPVASHDLVVIASTTPGKIKLPVSKKAKVGEKSVTVTITLKNTSGGKLTHVVLQRAWARPVDPTEQLDQIDFAKTTFPLDIGTIAAHKTVTKAFRLVVTGDGDYKIDTLATYGTASGNARVSSSGGRFTATVPALYFTSTLDDDSSHSGTPVVKGGHSFYLDGVVKNVSSYKTLCLWPLYPKLIGNAGGVGPVDTRAYGTGRDVIAPPAAGSIKPGTSMPIGMTVRTRSDGSTRSEIKLNPRASVLGKNATCDAVNTPKTAKPLGHKQKTIVKGSLKHTGAVDVSVPGPVDEHWYDVAYDLGAGLTLGSIKTLGDTLIDTAIAAREAFDGYVHNPKLLLPTLEVVYALGGLVTHYWQLLSVDEKDALWNRITGVLALATNDAWQALFKGGSASLEPFMASVEKAYEHGSNRELAHALGFGVGSNATKVVIDIALAEMGAGLAKKVPALARAFAKVGGESVTFARMKEIPAGKLLNFTEGANLWGAALDDWKAFKRIAKEENVLIGVRGRAPVSVKNLNEGAVWKNEKLKPKNVSNIDRKWLGFPDEDGLVGMRSYSAKDYKTIMDRIKTANLSDTQRKEILKRFEVRYNEVPNYLKKIKEMSKKGEIDVGFNYRENGINEPSAVDKRKFTLTRTDIGDGSSYYRPWQQKLSVKPGAKLPKWCRNFGHLLGVLCRVTGDMDGVYIADPAGRALSPEKIIAVYKRLAKAGWQHPETFTWVDQMTGEFYFNAKKKILAGLTAGGEKVMEFAPDSKVRAVWLDLEKSVMTGPQDYFIARNGGMQSLRK